MQTTHMSGFTCNFGAEGEGISVPRWCRCSSRCSRVEFEIDAATGAIAPFLPCAVRSHGAPDCGNVPLQLELTWRAWNGWQAPDISAMNNEGPVVQKVAAE
jgi:hypothetical protein